MLRPTIDRLANTIVYRTENSKKIYTATASIKDCLVMAISNVEEAITNETVVAFGDIVDTKCVITSVTYK
jgi:hypothetical protein